MALASMFAGTRMSIGYHAHGIRFEAGDSITGRVIWGLVSIASLGAFIFFAHEGSWSGQTDGEFVAGRLIFSLLLAAIGLTIALRTTLVLDFDGSRRVLTRTTTGPLKRETGTVGFDLICAVEAEMCQPNAGADHPVVRITIRGEPKSLIMSGFNSAMTSEFWAYRIRALLRGEPVES